MKRKPITDRMKLALVRLHNPLVACHYRLAGDCRGLWLPFINAQYDHHLALIDGGKHTVENLRYICQPCHKIKSAREHIANCKAKRLASGGRKRKGPPMRSRGFNKTLTKKFDGLVVSK